MGAAETLQPMLIALAARCLRVPESVLDPDAPLARYGLDSLNVLELGVAVSEATGVELDEEALFDAPSLRELAARIIARGAQGADGAPPLAQMRADAVLALDIDPTGLPTAGAGPLLLTGATGFLGAHLLQALQRSGAAVVCLVRAADDAEARARLQSTLCAYQLDPIAPQVRVVAADITRARFGLSYERYTRLASEARAVVHCAAEVNWVAPYDRLRAVNVVATEALLRFACTAQAKSFHFVSSLAAGYSSRDRLPLDEDAATDPAGIHLGYGQSKWVAEALVAAARRRGLTTVIYRPSLVLGHSRTGLGNDSDLFARLIRGSIALGAAPDIAWPLDPCPVDFVAAGIARGATRPDAVLPVMHLRSSAAPGWREAVLWLNGRGYRVRLEPFEDWLERVREAAHDADHPLAPLLAFLARRPPGEGGRALPELYAEPYLRRWHAKRSDDVLSAWGMRCPRLSAGLLERYVDRWIDRGVLPASKVPTQQPLPRQHRPQEAQAIEAVLRAHFADPALEVQAVHTRALAADHGILGELTSWRAGGGPALRALDVQVRASDGRPATLALVLKRKFPARVVLETAEVVAAQCGPALGAAFTAYREASELAGSCEREIALYRAASHALRDCMPLCFGVIEDESGPTLVLERVEQAVGSLGPWDDAAIAAALTGIARVHAQFLGRRVALGALGVDLFEGHSAAGAAHDWWQAAVAHARPWIWEWLGEGAAGVHAELACGERQRPEEDRYRTLIHRDFNPRNLALRATPLGPHLCAFDWELAGWGLPQRDVVELTCFALEPRTDARVIDRWLELARLRLERAAGVDFDSARWRRGARVALADFGVRRLPLYFMLHRFRPQHYLERVARTWWRMVGVVGAEA